MTHENRTVYGFTPSGDRILLGYTMLTDSGVDDFMDYISAAFNADNPTSFHIGSAVFNTKHFSGVQVASPASKADEIAEGLIWLDR